MIRDLWKAVIDGIKRLFKRRRYMSYREFVFLFQYVGEEYQQELMRRLSAVKCPKSVCGFTVPANLNGITFGQLAVIAEQESNDKVLQIASVLVKVDESKLAEQDVEEVYGFANWAMREINRINTLFAAIRQSHSQEEISAGINNLKFGMFGIADWYARRMGITDHEEVYHTCWVRIYKAMDMDAQHTEYQKRLQQEYQRKNFKKR